MAKNSFSSGSRELDANSAARVRERDLEMVRRMATYGAGPGTTPEQALDVIRIWAEKKLAVLRG
jgi:hypothetical protein